MGMPREDFDGKLFINISSNFFFFFLLERWRTTSSVGVKGMVWYLQELGELYFNI